MKELLRKIGITQPGHYTRNNSYVIDLESSNEFNKVFSKFDKSDLVEENEEISVINLSVTNVMYMTEDYSFNLIADFDGDTYKVVVTEL